MIEVLSGETEYVVWAFFKNDGDWRSDGAPNEMSRSSVDVVL
jgi:hypothetical protein